MSVAGGMALAVDRALKVRARAFQVFTKNGSQWAGKHLTEADVTAFRQAWEASGLAPAAAHDSYLINPASPNPGLSRRSVEALAEEVRRCEVLGIPFLVIHPGTHMGAGVEEGCARASGAINAARELAPAPSVSMHVHAAGYDLVSERGWQETFLTFDAILGLENLRLFHLNDSKRKRGSLVDRHEHIGRGHLGTEPFARILRDPRSRRCRKFWRRRKAKTAS
jgi:deoxyribonuclease-4